MMKTLKLRHPVHAPNGNVLLSAGTVLNDEVIADLVNSSKNEHFDHIRLMQYGTIADNLDRLCGSPPYDKIFSDQNRKKSLFALMDQVELSAPLLQIIASFKSGDPYTYRHILVVFALSMLLAQDFIEDSHELQAAAQACTTHDMGKFCVPLEILRKTTLLGPHERNYLEHHSAAGYVLLSYFFKDPQHPAAITARDHHERCDGSGYPRGIQLDNRIVEIVAACDVFDALISNRPYRATAYDLRTALEEISDMASRGAIHWDIAKALICYNRKEHTPINKCIVSREKRGNPPSGNLYQGVGFAKSCKDGPADV